MLRGETAKTKDPQDAPAPLRGEPVTLPPGSRFGAYEILSPLGAGGMGEVYRARDTRLGREVAIKILPGNLHPDRRRIERFEQEARSASALNHPNIVTIYELGEVDGTSYISMELVEGEAVRELLASGSIPLPKVIHIAAQIADGLAKAHSAGIVHRDLKPENVMVSRDGLVKILDFGVAKLAPGRECGDAGHPPPADSSGHGHGHPRIHVSGTGERARSGFPLRPVFLWISSLRDADG